MHVSTKQLLVSASSPQMAHSFIHFHASTLPRRRVSLASLSWTHLSRYLPSVMDREGEEASLCFSSSVLLLNSRAGSGVGVTAGAASLFQPGSVLTGSVPSGTNP